MGTSNTHGSRSPFAIQIKNIRAARKLSQERIAERARMDHSLWSRLESDQRTPTRETIDKIAHGLGLPQSEADHLRVLAGFMPEDPAATVAHNPAMLRLWRFLVNGHIPNRVKTDVVAALDHAIAAVERALMLEDDHARTVSGRD
jgi:transcriptional regulator with XRE-family HTH domain